MVEEPLTFITMPRFLVLIIYNILLPVLFVVALPAWVIKMWRRGGYGSGLLERLAIFKTPVSEEPQGGVYVHAVSVGEVLIAVKLIERWRVMCPEETFVLAATTSTGHEIAEAKAPQQVRVIYSPVDFGFLVRAVFRRFSPKQIVLIEAETWPNLLNVARRRQIPVSMVNARLSARSEARFIKFAALVKPLFEMVACYCVQNEVDAKRFRKLGIPKEKIHVSGSIKFDPTGGTAPQRRDEFQRQVDDFGHGRRVVMAASTHAGEEKLIGVAHLQSGSDALYVVVPRHSERRQEVVHDLESLGFEVVLRSDYHPPKSPKKACLVIDTTGELRDWTAHADLMVIGKSWLGKGGQNPAEAIVAGVPVICGPHMGNFEPLITILREAEGIQMLESSDTLSTAIGELLNDPGKSQSLARNAQAVLSTHAQAVEKTVDNIGSFRF